MDEPVDPAIVEYIRATRERYTREAITERLRAAGRDADSIRRAWQVVDAEEPSARRRDWRPGWLEGIVLVLLGAIGAFLVYRDEPYGAGGIAPFVYVGAASLAFGLGKAGSELVDQDQRMWAAIGGGLVVAGLAYVSIASGPNFLGFSVFLGALIVGLATLALGWTDARVAGFAGASLPIVGWLLITGVCYSPLIGS